MAESDHRQPTKTALQEPSRQALLADRAATSRPAVEDLQRAARELQRQNEELRREQDELRLLNEAMERTVIELRLPGDAVPGGALVELALDRGEVRAGDAAIPLSEKELELREGSVRALFDLALALHERVPFRIGAENKAELGMRLLTGRPAAAARQTPVALSRLVTVAPNVA